LPLIHKALGWILRTAKRKKQINIYRLGVLAHVCNPSYSEGRDWED
jgi:hypothetical protein